MEQLLLLLPRQRRLERLLRRLERPQPLLVVAEPGPARREPLRRRGELLLQRDEPLAERGDAEALPLRHQLLLLRRDAPSLPFLSSSSAQLERAAHLARRPLDRVERRADVGARDDVVHSRPQPAAAAQEVDAGSGLRAGAAGEALVDDGEVGELLELVIGVGVGGGGWGKKVLSLGRARVKIRKKKKGRKKKKASVVEERKKKSLFPFNSLPACPFSGGPGPVGPSRANRIHRARDRKKNGRPTGGLIAIAFPGRAEATTTTTTTTTSIAATSSLALRRPRRRRHWRHAAPLPSIDIAVEGSDVDRRQQRQRRRGAACCSPRRPAVPALSSPSAFLFFFFRRKMWPSKQKLRVD